MVLRKMAPTKHCRAVSFERVRVHGRHSIDESGVISVTSTRWAVTLSFASNPSNAVGTCQVLEALLAREYDPAMCRNIRVLHDFEPPTTDDEIYAAALQYVRKVGGLAKITPGNALAVERATDAVAAITRALLTELPKRNVPRDREVMKKSARVRFAKRRDVAVR
jgi:hypothetical protein